MERWVVAAKRADFAAIGKEFGIDPVIARLIRNRDVQDRAPVLSFCKPHDRQPQLPHPVACTSRRQYRSGSRHR